MVLAGAGAVSRRLPLSANRAIGKVLGTLAWYVDLADRRIALANIARAFPDWPLARRRSTIRAMFRHLGTSLFEILWLPRLDAAARAQTTVFEGLDRVLPLVDAGRGVVAFTGHCGNWEWLAYAVATLGRPVTVLQRERNESEINQFITAIRRTTGIRTIDRGSAAAGRELIQAIRRGGFLAFLIDQNIRTESVKVPFFGAPALTPIGPAKLAIRTSAIAVAVFIERGDDGKQYIRFQEPIECRPTDDPIALTARLTAAVEEQIRRVPEQWVWMHQRWRERPKWDVSA
jgi:KDO2-lipid IV(A) lauroyltransferase